MDNIRLSFNFLKLTGTRLISAKDAANKLHTYVAVPIEHFFVPTNEPKPYLMCTMIPCPNAQYGDFMIKPFVSGQDWEQMSQEQRNATPIIGKGTFMRPAINKQIKQQTEQADVTDLDPNQLTPSQQDQQANGSAAPLASAPSLPVGQQTQPSLPPTRFEIIADSGQVFYTETWNQAAEFASTDNSQYHKIVYVFNNVRTSQWRWDESKITWIQDY